jgi:hypothetical protein
MILNEMEAGGQPRKLPPNHEDLLLREVPAKGRRFLNIAQFQRVRARFAGNE